MRRRTIVLMLLSAVALSLSAQLYQGRNYYKSSYQPNTNQQLDRLENQGWEYLEAVNTLFLLNKYHSAVLWQRQR